jgi:signal transduction histidine kinase
MRRDYDDKVRDLCQQLIEAGDSASAKRISRELQDTIRRQIQNARDRIHEVAPVLPTEDLFPKAN